MNLFYTEFIENRDHPRRFFLKGQEAVHAVRVLRLKEGEMIRATDGYGRIFEGEVERMDKNELQARITETVTIPALPADIVIAIGNIKKRDRLEFAIEKSVELGVKNFIVFRADHSEKQNIRINRLQSTALAAMKQSLRAWLPAVKEMDSLEDVVRTYSGEYRIIAADENTDPSVEELESEVSGYDEKLLFIVGPEGGFSHEESRLLDEYNIERISLGKYRLRTETAVVKIAVSLSVRGKC